MNDIEIARNAKLKDVGEIAKNLGLNEDEIETYGKYKAKITEDAFKRLKDKKDGKRNHQPLPPPRYLLRYLRGRWPGFWLQRLPEWSTR